MKQEQHGISYSVQNTLPFVEFRGWRDWHSAWNLSSSAVSESQLWEKQYITFLKKYNLNPLDSNKHFLHVWHASKMNRTLCTSQKLGFVKTGKNWIDEIYLSECKKKSDANFINIKVILLRIWWKMKQKIFSNNSFGD